MDPNRFDSISKLLASRRLSRRRVVAEAATGIAAGTAAVAGLHMKAAAQEATPAPNADHGPAMLFVQSFNSGSIAPIAGEEGRYTVTLDHGLGQTVYFSDRPDRIVGASATDKFLNGLGFTPDNPPNAALVIESASGTTDLAVVELFTPTFDPSGPTVTYEMVDLRQWEESLETGLAEVPNDLGNLQPSFGTAHLFIDDCPDWDIVCTTEEGGYNPETRTPREGIIPASDHDGWCYDWNADTCMPCAPWFAGSEGWNLARIYWADQCNRRFATCADNCYPWGVCVGCSSSL